MGQTQNDCRDRPGCVELTCLLVALAIWPASSCITVESKPTIQGGRSSPVFALLYEGRENMTRAQSAGQQVAITQRVARWVSEWCPQLCKWRWSGSSILE